MISLVLVESKKGFISSSSQISPYLFKPVATLALYCDLLFTYFSCSISQTAISLLSWETIRFSYDLIATLVFLLSSFLSGTSSCIILRCLLPSLEIRPSSLVSSDELGPIFTIELVSS
ncbi:unnamed protein product [Moneuplotes crassus]|uniref:Uncharacterized protein n=1 Tax=Euplotes crassus TaxID=5936 RepID=A0AAD1XFP4_EUPCR|nr:unnamed protein product [Moneuplotes crassus]